MRELFITAGHGSRKGDSSLPEHSVQRGQEKYSG